MPTAILLTNVATKKADLAATSQAYQATAELVRITIPMAQGKQILPAVNSTTKEIYSSLSIVARLRISRLKTVPPIVRHM